MAARMTRKAIAASTIPTTLPPTSTSESPPSGPAVAARARFGPSDSAYRPPAKRAGRPAPAIRPYTMIFQSADRLIQDIGIRSLSRGSGRSRLDDDTAVRADSAGPFRVHVLVVHLGLAGAPVDADAECGQDKEDDDDTEGAADAGRDAIGARPDDSGRRQGEYPGGRHPARHVPADVSALLAEPGA